MYNHRAGVVYGFHGCDVSVYEQLINGQLQKASTNEYDWLGHGCYFWENDPYRAYEFALQQKQCGKLSNPAVIGAVIDYGNCLDFTTRYAVNFISIAYDEFVKTINSESFEIPQNSGGKDKLFRNLDCSVIQYFHLQREDLGLDSFDTVRAPFIEGEEVYPGAGFMTKNHTQLCVRNTDCIKEYFKPRLDYTKYPN